MKARADEHVSGVFVRTRTRTRIALITPMCCVKRFAISRCKIEEKSQCERCPIWLTYSHGNSEDRSDQRPRGLSTKTSRGERRQRPRPRPRPRQRVWRRPRARPLIRNERRWQCCRWLSRNLLHYTHAAHTHIIHRNDTFDRHDVCFSRVISLSFSLRRRTSSGREGLFRSPRCVSLLLAPS